MADPRKRSEEGLTLLEMVITVAVVSIAFVAVLSAIAAMITSSALHRQLTRTEVATRNVAEFVKRPSTYVSCATTSTYDLTPASLPSGYSASIATVGVIDDAAAGNPTYTSSTCPGTDPGVQRVTVRVCPHGIADGVCTPTSRDAQTVRVIKRRAIT